MYSPSLWLCAQPKVFTQMRAQPGTLRAAEWTAHAGQHVQAGCNSRSEGHAPLAASVFCCCRVDGRRGADAHQRLERAPAADLVLAAAVHVLNVVQLRLIFLQVRRHGQRRGHMAARAAAATLTRRTLRPLLAPMSTLPPVARRRLGSERPAVASSCRTSPDRPVQRACRYTMRTKRR
jgi:hypothetical protein